MTVYLNGDISDGYNRLYNKFSGTPAQIQADVVDFVHLYPSADIDPDDKKYSWSALLRETQPNKVHIIIFVSRRTNTSSRYPKPLTDLNDPVNYGTVIAGQYIDRPVPVRVNVIAGSDPDILEIVNSTELSFINKGTEIVDDENLKIYTVLDRSGTGGDEIKLNKDWIDEDSDGDTYMWVVPPAAGAAKSSCITVFPTTIAF
jgi:hypothetical protein